MPLTWIYSWVMGRLPVLLAVAAVLGGLWWFGHLRYTAGEAALQARWDAATLKATEAARAKERGWRVTVDASDRSRNEALELVAAKDTAIGLLNDRVRYLATRPRPVASPAEPAQCLADLARERNRSATLGSLLAEGDRLIADLGRERDEAVIDLWGGAEAWPH